MFLNEVLLITKKIFSDSIGDTPFSGDTLFNELGIDSLVLVELAVYLSKKFEVTLVEFELEQANNVIDVTKLLEIKINRRANVII